MFTHVHAQKTHCFDTYGFVLAQFNTLKQTGAFSTYAQISSQELVNICSVSLDCLDKLTEVSGFIEKKTN